MWVQQKAAPELIGKPLHTDFPYDLVSEINVKKTAGYDHCGDNETLWAQHAGDPNYNLLNECCLAMNSGNPGGSSKFFLPSLLLCSHIPIYKSHRSRIHDDITKDNGLHLEARYVSCNLSLSYIRIQNQNEYQVREEIIS